MFSLRSKKNYPWIILNTTSHLELCKLYLMQIQTKIKYHTLELCIWCSMFPRNSGITRSSVIYKN